ncbi:uncharacterized protein LOC144433628 [Glandiceps talaboti]
MASKEVADLITKIEKEIEDSQDALDVEVNQTERERILDMMEGNQRKFLELSKPDEDETQKLRRSSRTRKPTQKMAEFLETEKVKRHKQLKRIFAQRYEAWKAVSKTGRAKLKGHCTEDSLNGIFEALNQSRDEVIHAYEAVREVSLPDNEMLRQADTCTAITNQLLRVVSRRCKSDDDESYGDLLHDMLLYDDNASIFSTTSCKVSESTSVRRAEAAAELAAQEAELKMLKAKQVKQAELDELQRLQEQKKREMECLEREKELEKAKAKLKVYDESSGQQTTMHHTTYPTSVPNDTISLTRALQDSLSMSRLPMPEPSVFMGDPLQYVQWKTSFKTLIENKGITAAEKMYYLRRYLSGDALKAVGGFFYSNSEDSYRGTWNLLEERYGHPLIIQRAFRDKLSKWQRIGPKDSVGLQEFADFLKACRDAIPHVPELGILSDCEENRKLLVKLPDWAAARWNQKVTEMMDSTSKYPNFEDFVTFVAKEARTACNPISSLHAIRESGTFERDAGGRRGYNRSKGTTLATESTEVNKHKEKTTSDSNTYTPKPCLLCRKSDHQINTCPEFKSKTLEQRKQFVQENRVCFSCLKRGHNSRECRRKLICERCKKRHPTMLHDESKQRESTDLTKSNTEEASVVSCKVELGDSNSTSMIVPVWVSSTESPSNEVLTYALLDTQSDSTFILEDTAKSLSIQCQPVRLKLSTMTSASSMIDCSAVSNLLIRGMSTPTHIQIQQAYTRDYIPANRSHIPTSTIANKWPHLQRIAHEIAPLQGCEVGMLIGYNCPQALAPRETIVGKNDEPFAIKTDLGWSIIGYNDPRSHSYATSICNRITVKETPCISPKHVISALEADFSEKGHGEKVISQEDLQFLNILETSIHQTESGHYSMPLPFKSGKPTLPKNKRTAVLRLNHLRRKFATKPKYYADYKKFMDDVIEKGDVEEVEGQGEEGRVWYIPHHGVYHPQKPEKIRVVFDCSARFAGTSLNGHLLTGPDLINCLIGVLCRFRKHHIAVMCDIERMFHQFLVNEEDRNYLRFLWWENGDTSIEPKEYRMKVHLFGAASSPGCANYGLKYLANQNEREFPLGASFIKKNFYVDDGLISADSVNEATALVKEAQKVCAKGGLHLHKFISNSREVMETIPTRERAAGVKDVDLSYDNLPIERALGIQWCVETDTFKFHIQAKDQPPTRRGILSTVASIYDPLGFLAPFILIGKGILQEMCRNGIDWDEPLPEKLRPRWERWKADFTNLRQIQIPRCYKPPNFGHIIAVELHHFSDASTSGYSQCSYLRLVGENRVHCSLVSGKARVAPTKVVTIPRLELTAAVVSSNMSSMLKEELEFTVDREYFWTDSQVVLGYIANEARKFHIFVANRIQRIRQVSKPSQWHYVSTEVNPADHASRGVYAAELLASNWFRGPEFLWERELTLSEESDYQLNIGDPEVKNVTSFMAATSTESFNLKNRISRFSEWSKVVGAVARIRRLVRNKKGSKDFSSPQERQEAERYIIRCIQGEAFAKEIKELKLTRVKKGSSIHNLNPFLDSEGVLRVGGRLKKADIPDSVRHPAILPKDSHVTRLLISHFHNKVQHQGRGITFNEIRANGYWIMGGIKVVALHIYRCIKCRRLRRPVEEQKMANLPEDRVEPSPPFTFCGMDCFGPFIVKVGRKECKNYGLLFTCMCSRAVHIETLDDMSTDSFINGLRCFIAIRGPVQRLRSDQGTNFVGAKNEFKEALKELDMERIKVFLTERQCEFVMNPPHASHAGGVWERHIKTIRSVLSSMLQQSQGRLDSASLRTFLYEVMAIVNSRPLTTESLNDPMSPEPLTPNHLLHMKSSVALPPPGKFVKEDLYVRKRWRRVQYLAEQFWGRWRKEYLNTLTQRQKWNTPRRNTKKGDIVLLKDDQVPRMEWPLAIVTETTEGEDGLVRKVKIQVSTKNLDKKGRRDSKLSILERPIQRLILLLGAD